VSGSVRVLVTTPLEEEHLAHVAAVDRRLEVVYPQDLVAPARYPAEHRLPEVADAAARARWRDLLREAEVLFDFGPLELAGELRELPRLRWLQGTSAGVGQLVHRIGLDQREDVTVTTASGVHGRPLAEFVLLSLLVWGKDLPRMLRGQREHRWQRYAGHEVAGTTVGVVGMGRIGREIARVLRALDARVLGVARTVAGRSAADMGADELVATGELDTILPRIDVLVLAVPHTSETQGLLDRRRIGLLPPHARVINIARGDVIDEDALVEALREGRLRGAALDVFREEPLPPQSPLWDLPNVLVSPHSASTVVGENGRIIELFCDNLRRYLAGEPLRNVLRPELLY
jgi:glyoxylate/hydroxypyruvate reductase